MSRVQQDLGQGWVGDQTITVQQMLGLKSPLMILVNDHWLMIQRRKGGVALGEGWEQKRAWLQGRAGTRRGVAPA